MKAYTEITSMDEIDRIYKLGDKEKIAQILSRGDAVAAAEMIKLEKDPLKALRRILNYIQRENLPTYNLGSEVSDAVQAVQYCTYKSTLSSLLHWSLSPVATGDSHIWANIRADDNGGAQAM